MGNRKIDEEKKDDIELENEQNYADTNNETSKNLNEEENNEKKDTATIQEEAKKQDEENLQNKLLRLQADFLNYKNRAEKEKFSIYSNATADILTDLLPVIDNFERALEAETSKDSALKEGLQMVYSQFMGILNKKGLQVIEALNKPFDPNFHFGVAFGESDAKDNTVIEVFQKGYSVNEKVIRPAMVKVCKK